MANLPFTGNLREFSGLLYAISTNLCREDRFYLMLQVLNQVCYLF